jgi:hypothetical protein
MDLRRIVLLTAVLQCGWWTAQALVSVGALVRAVSLLHAAMIMLPSYGNRIKAD